MGFWGRPVSVGRDVDIIDLITLAGDPVKMESVAQSDTKENVKEAGDRWFSIREGDRTIAGYWHPTRTHWVKVHGGGGGAGRDGQCTAPAGAWAVAQGWKGSDWPWAVARTGYMFGFITDDL
jgi:hypothetical protein